MNNNVAEGPPRHHHYCCPYTIIIPLSMWINPFLSTHIPYAQSEGILPKYGLLQWVEYISKSTQWISTKLCRDMVEALSFQKTLKYWWPLTYIQGHVIQDGRQIHFSKSNLGLKLPTTQPIFGQIQLFLFCFVAGDQFSTLDGKAIPTMVPCVFWLQRNDPPRYYSSLLWKIALSPFSTENDWKIDPNCHSATLDIFAMTYKCF